MFVQEGNKRPYPSTTLKLLEYLKEPRQLAININPILEIVLIKFMTVQSKIELSCISVFLLTHFETFLNIHALFSKYLNLIERKVKCVYAFTIGMKFE